jgi:hypothetical protein
LVQECCAAQSIPYGYCIHETVTEALLVQLSSSIYMKWKFKFVAKFHITLELPFELDFAG